MRKSRMGKKLLLFILTASIMLTSQEVTVLAEPEQTESLTEGQGETQSADTQEGTDMGNTDGTGNAGGTGDTGGSDGSDNTDGSDGTGGTGDADGSDGTGGTGDADGSDGTGGTGDIGGSDDTGGSGDTGDADDSGSTGGSTLRDDPGFSECIIKDSQNPEGAIVNLFDYKLIDNASGKEMTHDYVTVSSNGTQTYYTYNQGISENHLLRFGYRDTGGDCEACLDSSLQTGWWNKNNETIDSKYYGQGFYGDWNEYNISKGNYGGLRKGIVQNRLDNGFPRLNLEGVDSFGGYVKDGHFEDIYKTKTNESLAYLFKVEDTAFKESYENVLGLFQLDRNGYYYYNSAENFAEYDAVENEFILYNSPGVGKEEGEGKTKNENTNTDWSEANYGQFFPFNDADDVFDAVVEDGNGGYKLTYQGTGHENDTDGSAPIKDSKGNSYIQCYAPDLNHYLGMTLEVPFLQPAGGDVAHGIPMEFEFSGDDDVWIFIDDVLVADLGGIHDAYYLRIDFSTGDVFVCKKSDLDTTSKLAVDHTLESSFEDAGITDVAFTGNTFADNTVHTLKMFYLERGNIASNLSLKFNLQVARYNQIKKVDQDGKPIAGVEFELYEAVSCGADDPNAILCSISAQPNASVPFYVKKSGSNVLTSLKTNAEGIAEFTDYSFGSGNWKYYILEEKNVPDGYSPPRDIVLEYNPGTKTLIVANRWETGSYASFTSYVNEKVNTPIYYAQYNDANGEIKAPENGSNTPVDSNSRENGLVLAVPMLKNAAGKWLPLYGSNVEGFSTIKPDGPTSDDMEKALLKAALKQAELNADGKGEAWYLEWSNNTMGLVGVLSDLPGRADRYRLLNNTNADMQMAYLLIEPGAFTKIGISAANSDDRYDALKAYAKNNVDNAVNEIYDSSAVNLLDTSDFMRVFRSLIYIPNVQRELRVKKVDESGKGIPGAEFTIYTDAACRNPVAKGTTDAAGLLIFKPAAQNVAGYASIDWKADTCYLKETRAPEGYTSNDTVITIRVDDNSVYADAGEADDGVSVEASVGRLYQTMTKYASDGEVNVTLENIIISERKKASGQFDKGWIPSGNTLGLSYDNDEETYLNANGTDKFSTDTGFLSVSVKQGQKPSGSAIWEDLTGIDITGLFSQLNVVVVKDRRILNEQRELRLQKVNEDDEPLNGAEFGLYGENGALAASGTTGLVDGQDGILVFRVKQSEMEEQGEAGFALLDEWKAGNYYLQEISPPPGYQLNDRKIPVVVEASAVYADAGTADNGISVKAGAGYYLEKDNQNPPAKITVSAQGQVSGAFKQDAWGNLGALGSKVLSHQNYPAMGMDYGLTDGDPFFETDTGFIRNDIVSNGKNITDQFSQLNIVVVTDQKTENPEDPEDPEDPKDPENPEGPENPKDPENPEEPENPKDPENPEGPENPKDPENPEGPENPKDPENPEGPEAPKDPGNPADPQNPDANDRTDSDADKDTDENADESVFQVFDALFDRVESIGTGTPQTGDDSLIWWWALLSIVSLTGIGATVSNLIFRKRKRGKEGEKKEQAKEKQKKQHPAKEKQKKQKKQQKHSLKRKRKKSSSEK